MGVLLLPACLPACLPTPPQQAARTLAQSPARARTRHQARRLRADAVQSTDVGVAQAGHHVRLRPQLRQHVRRQLGGAGSGPRIRHAVGAAQQLDRHWSVLPVRLRAEGGSRRRMRGRLKMYGGPLSTAAVGSEQARETTRASPAAVFLKPSLPRLTR